MSDQGRYHTQPYSILGRRSVFDRERSPLGRLVAVAMNETDAHLIVDALNAFERGKLTGVLDPAIDAS